MFELEMLIMSFFSSLIHTIIIIFLNFRNVHRKNTTNILLFLSLFLCTLFVYTLVKVPGLMLPIMFAFIVLFCFWIYKLNIFESIALALINVFTIIVPDSALLWLFVNVLKLDILSLNSTLYIFIANSIILFLVVVIILIRHTFFRKHNSFKISIKFFFLICVVFIIIVSTLNLTFNKRMIQTNPTAVIMFNLVAFAIYFIICLFLVLIYTSSNQQQILLDQQTREYKLLIEYTSTIERLYDDIRNQKHDFMNVLFSLKGYIDKEQFEELKEYYYSSVLKEYEEKQPNMFTSSLNLIQNPGLKGILSYKLNQAMNDGIKVYVNIFSKITIQGMDNLDLCKVIGILIDNAIEASMESEKKEIHLGMEKDEGVVSIIIANTYLYEPNLDHINRRGYSTKGKNRGLGLFNVKETLFHYPSVQLKTTINNNTFFQELIIPDL